MESDRKIAAPLPPAPLSGAPPPNGARNGFPQGRPMHGRTSGPTRRSTKGQWTPEEDEILRKAVQRYKGKNWKKIAECFKDRTDVQCLHRWQKVLNPELIKGPWSKEEDEIIIQLVDKYGPKKWSTIAQHLPGRIGKQCRERWHNHLNPAINKEAWTQEEEIILIRAHQIHGNRWAELTKYLPGRTDNAIKNHWNSSVRKKLDSYVASGLLAQFQGLPLVSHQCHQSISSASLHTPHSSAASSVCKDGAEAENNSECSQVDCSQTASDMSNTACQTREDFLMSEESDHGKLQTTSPAASCSVQYCTFLDDITITIPDIPYDFSCPSKYSEENFPKDSETYTAIDCNFGVIGIQNIIPFELAAESSNMTGNHLVAERKHERVHIPSHQSTRYNVPALVNDMVMASDVHRQKQKMEEHCLQVPYLLEGGDRFSANLTTSCDIIDMDRYIESLSFQSSFQLSGPDGSRALLPNNPLNAAARDSPHFQNLSYNSSEVAVGNDLVMSTKEPDQINDSLTPSQVQEGVVNAGLTHAHNHPALPCHDHIDVDLTEQTNPMESSRLVPVNTFGPETSDSQQTHLAVVPQQEERTSEQEAGTLCYEPPRFPSLDIPFFRCDLAQPGSDALQEYSPLGIRQLMMSNMDSLTPLKLWDSPSSSGESPDAVLKSAAKTFACTPSILKKRHRDLLSPLSPFSERRYGKKIGHEVNKEFQCTSGLTKEFSCLDVRFGETDRYKGSASPSHDQNTTTEASIEDKENICPASQEQTRDAKCYHDSRDKTSEKEWNKNDMVNAGKEGILERDNRVTVYDDQDHTSETPRGILVERPFNDGQLSTPDAAGSKAGLKSSENPSGVEQSSRNNSKKGTMPERGTDKAASFVSPSSLGQKKQGNDFAVSGQSVSAVSTEMVGGLVSEVGTENLNIFGGTPFRRSIESPSAWKSPWYFSSLSSCPKFDTDITIEDIGIFMSPGFGSMDAIGLMKQINEQSADIYADAREVLGSETPESILRQRILKSQNPERESNNAAESQHESRLHLASNILTERRVLDFSECGTPAKSAAKKKSVSTASLSSPSCLLKNYR